MQTRPRRAKAASAVALVLSLSLYGCSTSAIPDPTYCMPLVTVSPSSVHPGDTVTITVDDGCTMPTPEGGWELIAAPVGQRDVAVTGSTEADLSAGFTADLVVPADFPTGEAFAGIDNWDFSQCADTSGSCASPTGNFEVVDG